MVHFKIPSFSPPFQADFRLPDLLLTAYYHLDPKTGFLMRDVKLEFQADGPCKAELNFKAHSLVKNYAGRVFYFQDLKMDAVFGAGVTEKEGGHFTINAGVEKDVKGGAEVGVESGVERPGTLTYVHAVVGGMMTVFDPGKNKAKLEAWGNVI